MELLNLIVPMDKCPLDFLAEMEEKTQNAWIFMHRSCIANLEQSDGVTIESGDHECHTLTWEATEEYPETILTYGFFSEEWSHVIAVKADDIAFKEIDNIVDPEYVIRLKIAT